MAAADFARILYIVYFRNLVKMKEVNDYYLNPKISVSYCRYDFWLPLLHSDGFCRILYKKILIGENMIGAKIVGFYCTINFVV